MEPIVLIKGGNINLSKTNSFLKNINIVLNWTVQEFADDKFDLDASVLMLTKDGKARTNQDLIYYHKYDSDCGSIHHKGDDKNVTGKEGRETIQVFLDKVPSDIHRLRVCASVHDPEMKQNFGQVLSSSISLVNNDDNKVMVRHDLTEDASTDTAIIFADLYRHESEWKYKAVLQACDSYADLLRAHGFVA